MNKSDIENFASIVEWANAWYSKGGSGAINVHFLQGWLWDRENRLKEEEKEKRFYRLKRITEVFIEHHPDFFKIVNEVEYSDPENKEFAKMLPPGGVNISKEKIIEFFGKLHSHEQNEPNQSGDDNSE